MDFIQHGGAMKILLTSDLHAGVRKKNGVMFINFALNYLNHIKNYCKRNKITHIFFLGDLLEKSSSVKHEYFVPLFNKIQEIIDSNINVVHILGNHDIYTVKNDSLIETFPGKIVKNQEHVTLNGQDINLLSYTEEKIKDLSGDYLFTHLPIESFQMNNEYIPDKKYYEIGMFKDFKKVFSGHYHRHQNNKNVVYLGSPFQLNFAERDTKKGFIVLDISRESWQFVEYKNGPNFKYLEKNNINEEVKNTFIKVKAIEENVDFHSLKLDLYKRGALSVELDFVPDQQEEEVSNNVLKLENNLSDTVKKYLMNYKQKNIDNNKLLSIFERVMKEMD